MRDAAKLLLCMVPAVCAYVGPLSAHASDAAKLPTPISIIVPFTPGGAPDSVARLIAKQLEENTGSHVIVENRPGAAGAIGAGYVARAAPDGRTLLMGSTNTGLATIVNDKLQYDVLRDFAPVADAAENIVIMAANRDFPANNLTEAVELLRKNPGKYSYGSPGVGTLQHLALALLLDKLKLNVVHVPYKGASPAMAETAGGIVPLVGGGIAPALPFLKDGSIKILGIANSNNGMFSDIPEVKGVQYFQEVQKDSAVRSWIGLFAPAGVDDDVLDALHDAVNKVVASETFRKQLQALSMVPNVSSREEFARKVEQDFNFWKNALAGSAVINQ